MEKDIESIISMLTKDVGETRRHLRIVKIYGMGGIGKTTLARKIYNHKQVVKSYCSRAWVCITQQFQTRAILGNSRGICQLLMGIHKFLEEMNKKCLFIPRSCSCR